ncbi:hypothetical protein PTI98_007063 [Pleurotus ostreatus]|nr:hypothetical protein PTI98_007063 [Pleurotus ostreatus]
MALATVLPSSQRTSIKSTTSSSNCQDGASPITTKNLGPKSNFSVEARWAIQGAGDACKTPISVSSSSQKSHRRKCTVKAAFTHNSGPEFPLHQARPINFEPQTLLNLVTQVELT